MSEIIKSFKINPTTTNSNSRYLKLNRLLNADDEQYIETYDPKKINKSADDTYHIVTKKDINRLDLISFQYYKTPLLWWVIAEASGITDPFNVPLNTVLRIPKMTNLYGAGGVLS